MRVCTKCKIHLVQSSQKNKLYEFAIVLCSLLCMKLTIGVELRQVSAYYVQTALRSLTLVWVLDKKISSHLIRPTFKIELKKEIPEAVI